MTPASAVTDLQLDEAGLGSLVQLATRLADAPLALLHLDGVAAPVLVQQGFTPSWSAPALAAALNPFDESTEVPFIALAMLEANVASVVSVERTVY